MEELANLPPTALVAFGLGLALIFGVRYLGLISGEKSTPVNNAAAAQVAAVIVDPTALNKLTEQAMELTKSLLMLVKVGEEMAENQRHMATELDRVREELRIQRELERRK
jgi:hypothetical protein